MKFTKRHSHAVNFTTPYLLTDAVEQGAEDEVETARARKIASRALLEAHWVANSNGGSTTGR